MSDIEKLIDWPKALELHITDMQAREEMERRKSDEHRTKAEQIMSERMELQHFIYETKIRERA